MTIVELNPVGNFDPWDPIKIEELRKDRIAESVCENLLYENETIKLWEISLMPYERIAFRKCKNIYSCTALTTGVAISRNANGSIKLLRLKKGDTAYWDCRNNEHISDLENIGEETLRISVTEFLPVKKTSLSQLLSLI